MTRGESREAQNPTGGAARERESDHGIRRIVVALDASTDSWTALEAAARMASRLGAELLGLLVEDVNVRRIADLPFVQEVGFFTASCRRVETRELSRQLDVQAGRVRRQFQTSTRSLQTRCTFRVVRGRVALEVLAAAATADVVILGKGAWSPFKTGHLTPAVRQVLSQSSTSTLVLREDTRVEPPMRVVYDGTALGEKALATAAGLARDDGGQLMVFLLANGPDEAARLRDAVRQRLAGQLLEISFQSLTERSVPRLAHLIAHEEGGTLVMPAGTGALEDETVLEFLDATRVPVLLVR